MASSKSRRDSRTAPTKTSSFRKYLDALLSSPSRVFLTDIIYANIGKYITDSKPLTNKNFTPEAIETLRVIAENKGLTPGESIRVTDEDYNQYGSEFDYNIRTGQTSPDLFTKLGNLSPADELKYVIGQAVIKMDDAGNITLKDQYDFNFYADFEKGEVLTPEEFDAAGISLKDALVSSWENRPDNMSFAENVGFLLGSRDYEGTEKDTARKVEIDLGNISEPFEVERPKEPTKTVGSKGRKKSPVVAEVLQEQFSPTRPKARPEGLAAKPKQKNEKIEELSKEIVEYFETLPERELAPETSLRPIAKPETLEEGSKLAPRESLRPVAPGEASGEDVEMGRLFGEVQQYLDNPLAPTRSLRPVAKPEGLPSTQEDTAVESSLRPRMRPEFAEGGAVMDDQMNKLFMARGGLKDDGMNMDPVSGNEVPPGSLAQEVRDDIPAQLSDGEYVVPADVVRYYGVKFFEDLRQEAKVGLSDMEMNGRIGGEPAPDMAGAEAAPTMMGGMPARDIPPEMLTEMARQAYAQGQAPVQMQAGGVASSLLRNTNFFGNIDNLLGEDRAQELSGASTEEDEPTFRSETPTFNPLNYMRGNPAVVGSSTIGQIGSTLPGYTYRYIDPITGELIDVAPGETPPPNAIPAPVEVSEPRDESDSDQRREAQVVDPSTYDPTNINGVNFVDPMAGIDAALGTTFGERAVVAGAGMFGGPVIGAATKGFTQVNSLATARANLEVVGEQFGFDSKEYIEAEKKIKEAADSTFADNIIPESLQNGSMILDGARKRYEAYQQATGDKGSGGGPKSTVGGGGQTPAGPTREDRDDDDGTNAGYGTTDDGSPSGAPFGSTPLGGSGTAFDASGVDAATSSYGGTGYYSDYQEEDFMSDFDVDDEGYISFNKGGLMQRKSPVKKK